MEQLYGILKHKLNIHKYIYVLEFEFGFRKFSKIICHEKDTYGTKAFCCENYLLSGKLRDVFPLMSRNIKKKRK